MSYPFVPLVRHLHFGLKGRDVTAVQLALRKAGFRKEDPTGRYGAKTKHQVGEFKQHHNIEKEEGYDDKTHKALWPSFGPVANDLYKTAYKRKNVVTVRQKIANVALYGYDQRYLIHYSQGALRMRDFAPPPNVPNYTDCSAFVTWCYKSAGAADPNGFGYNGYGFTGTLLLHGNPISLSGTLTKGDLVFYGHPVSHVAVCVSSERVVSHGSEIGPLLLPIRYRSDINCARRYVPGN